MIVPYTHSAALAQMPAFYYYKDTVITVYPLRLKDILDMDRWLKFSVIKTYTSQIELLPDSERDEFVKGMEDIVLDISSSSGKGNQLLWGSIDALVHLVTLLTRGSLDETHIRELFFSKGLTEEAKLAITEMKQSVWRKVPPLPKLNVEDKKPRYEATQDEGEARIYHVFAERYGWTYDQVVELTDYQAFWYGYMFPEEREHYEDMDAMIQQNRASRKAYESNATEAPKPGVIHFTSPEEYEAWKAKRENNNA